MYSKSYICVSNRSVLHWVHLTFFRKGLWTLPSLSGYVDIVSQSQNNSICHIPCSTVCVCVCEGVFFLTVGLLCFVLLWHDTCVNMSLMWSLLSLNPTEGHGQLRGQTVHRDPHTAGTPTGDREAWPFQRSLA